MTSPNPHFLTAAQAAKILGVSRAAVYKKLKAGQIPSTEIGGHLFIPAKNIEMLVTEELTSKLKHEIERGVSKAVKEYGETLKRLGKE